MKKIVFTEEFCSPENLFPFTLTRQIQDIRIGILTIREKWEYYLDMDSYDKNEGDYKDLNRSLFIDETIGDDIIYLIHGNILPTQKLVRQVRKLQPGEFLSSSEKQNFIYCISKKQVLDQHNIKAEKAVELDQELRQLNYSWDITANNSWAIKEDIELLSGPIKSQKISSTNKIIGNNKIFIEKGAEVEHCYLNTTEGPIYIGKDAIVMEGSMLRGPIAICEGAVVKMGSKIYGSTTVGPFCTVGGEIKNSVLFGYSNKAHDGYLGDSVIGEWCNLGAGTTNSNLKNNASEVLVWTPYGQKNVGIKCGVFMGDYSRTAINTSINTGTVIGTCCNVFGSGLAPKYIPSFSWGSEGVQRYNFEKALTHVQNWKTLRGQNITQNERTILKHIFDHY